MEWIKEIAVQTQLAAMALLVGVINLRRLSSVAQLILLLIFINVSVDIYATYIDVVQNKHTHFLYNIFLFFEYPFIIFIYSIASEKKDKKLFHGLAIIICIYSFFILYSKDIEKINYINLAINSIVISTTSYLLIRKKIVTDNLNINDIMLWFLAANLILGFLILPPISIVKFYKKIHRDLFDAIFNLKNVAYILWSVLIAFGFLCQKKKTI